MEFIWEWRQQNIKRISALHNINITIHIRNAIFFYCVVALPFFVLPSGCKFRRRNFHWSNNNFQRIGITAGYLDELAITRWTHRLLRANAQQSKNRKEDSQKHQENQWFELGLVILGYKNWQLDAIRLQWVPAPGIRLQGIPDKQGWGVPARQAFARLCRFIQFWIKFHWMTTIIFHEGYSVERKCEEEAEWIE